MSEKTKKKSGSYLALDSSGKEPAICLALGDKLVAYQSDGAENNLLAKATQEILSGAGLSVSDLSGIIVSLGPGSFTGLRIGLAFAKGLASAQNIPLIGVDRFSQALRGLADSAQSVPDYLALSMKTGSWYLYQTGREEQRDAVIERIRAVTTEEVLALGGGNQGKELKIGFVDFDPPESFLSQEAGTLSSVRVNSKIEDLLILGCERLSGEQVNPHWEELEPIYAQKSNAELNFDKKNRDKKRQTANDRRS